MATRHRDGSVLIGAPSEQVFAYVDDHEQLASHMNESSWMMGGGRMVTVPDGRRGKAVGSRIRMSGTVFGMRLYLDEVVTLRTPPIEKAWETVGTPRLLVIGPYEMGFHVRPEAGGTRLYVFIDYDLPQKMVRQSAWLDVRRLLRKMVRAADAQRGGPPLCCARPSAGGVSLIQRPFMRPRCILDR